jgi:hypothetical protein
MNFTFGIITYGGSDKFIDRIVESIRSQLIPLYEIIIIGETLIRGNDITNIDFDETVKPGWITRKKNIICQLAKYDNIVLLHDYIYLENDWYNGFLQYNTDFDICVNRIQTKDGNRFRDFLLFPNGLEPLFQNGALLPYDYQPSVHLSKLMYISGAYYIIKKSIALKFPLNENLISSMGEDVDLCHRLSDANIIFKCNKYSSVKLLKQQTMVGFEREISNNDIVLLSQLDNTYLTYLFEKQKKMQRSWVLNTFNINLF